MPSIKTNLQVNSHTCQSIMNNQVPLPEIEVGAERSQNNLLTGMRFLFLSVFTGTTPEKFRVLWGQWVAQFYRHPLQKLF